MDAMLLNHCFRALNYITHVLIEGCIHSLAFHFPRALEPTFPVQAQGYRPPSSKYWLQAHVLPLAHRLGVMSPTRSSGDKDNVEDVWCGRGKKEYSMPGTALSGIATCATLVAPGKAAGASCRRARRPAVEGAVQGIFASRLSRIIEAAERIDTGHGGACWSGFQLPSRGMMAQT